ncbi:nucleotide exchange factor GrpE [Meiothermus rufus]|uniref:nucleotide exchange factor GrpE n=1 Tax=Meiothermus rufus TaxID=604332 RepID=UPI00040ED5EA|nr:nucleotide exchange factor GrpE [Meiothermus rufus]
MEKENLAPEPTTEPAGEASEVDRLKGEVEFLKAELEASKDKFLRLYADFENYKKRMVHELEAAQRNGKFEAVRALLGTMDDLERALGFASVKPEDLIPGVRSVLDNFVRNLKSLGVESVPGAGSEFDPRYHEAIGAVEGEEGKVVHVYQQGFKYGDLLVRPARVVVGSGKTQNEESPSQNSEPSA